METQGIKYAGSKRKIIPHILQTLSETQGVRTVLDGFSGSTRVAQAFAQSGLNTTANDTAVWSEVFANCYLKSDKPDSFYAEILAHLNTLQGVDGWFTEHYGGGPDDRKKPFQIKNTRKLDAIRDEIDRIGLDFVDKSVVLTSLILALDSVDSTLGHYASYLSGWSVRSNKDLRLKLPKRFALTSENTVLRGDVFDAIQGRSFDLAYFDPPYGSDNAKMPTSRVRYSAYYHLWTTLVLNDKPAVFGKANRRVDSKDSVQPSVFENCRSDIVLNALERLIASTDARYVLLSYGANGRAAKADLAELLAAYGRRLKIAEIDHKRNVMSQMTSTKMWLNSAEKYKEYLFLMEK
ncbi:MAG TPA: DNA methyltransferase [Alphaproteobacteria bacterium]|nr:DNA methyltransferase [Alphaproteobacteria bacterium]